MRFPGRFVSFVVFGCLSGACDGVDGELAGQRVGHINEDFFDEETLDLGILGSYTGLAIVMVGMRDACGALTAAGAADVGTCGDYCDTMGRIADEYGANDETWTIYLFVTGETTAMVGTYAQANDLLPPSFYASVEVDDTLILQDWELCVRTCEDGGDVIPGDAWDAEDGILQITAYTPGERVEGNFELFMPEGEVDGEFKADFCPSFL